MLLSHGDAAKMEKFQNKMSTPSHAKVPKLGLPPQQGKVVKALVSESGHIISRHL